ncbi:MAG TPA: hypothetical protein VJY57_11130 [Thiopseudomonas sp.]|nr:hypothetical protein [Thiopseudomonas sp.]
MTSTANLMHEQEVRRQAMLQAMHIDVWLPRQTLVNAAPSRELLLDWETIDQVATQPAVQTMPRPQAAAASSAVSAPVVRSSERVSVRDKLALAAIKPSAKPALNTSVATPVDQPATQPAPVQAEPIPRFALQMLRADNCLLLVDLPTGEAFQSRDPDYQLLKDMLRAAGLTDQPSFLRQGTPLVWPILRTGNLMHSQNAAAARACVRDLLSVEQQAELTRCIWLVGEHAVRFGSADDAAALYQLQPFTEGVQAWSLPSLESVLEQPLLKRDIWRSMCAHRGLWQVNND